MMEGFGDTAQINRRTNLNDVQRYAVITDLLTNSRKGVFPKDEFSIVAAAAAASHGQFDDFDKRLGCGGFQQITSSQCKNVQTLP